ncbi:MAG: hypothetical protein R3F43_12040 [bacterium]
MSSPIRFSTKVYLRIWEGEAQYAGRYLCLSDVKGGPPSLVEVPNTLCEFDLMDYDWNGTELATYCAHLDSGFGPYPFTLRLVCSAFPPDSEVVSTNNPNSYVSRGYSRSEAGDDESFFLDYRRRWNSDDYRNLDALERRAGAYQVCREDRQLPHHLGPQRRADGLGDGAGDWNASAVFRIQLGGDGSALAGVGGSGFNVSELLTIASIALSAVPEVGGILSKLITALAPSGQAGVLDQVVLEIERYVAAIIAEDRRVRDRSGRPASPRRSMG